MQYYLQKLNTAQRDAATAIDGMNFILAGAGSGKTSVLTARTAYMIDSGVSPDEILLLTFTNKAAKEMKDRIISLIGENSKGITACTFHSFCAIFIRKNAHLLGLNPDYTILDSPDMIEAITMAKQDFLTYEKSIGNEYQLNDFPKTSIIASIYEMAINNCVSYEKAIKSNPSMIKYKREILDILQRFKTYKKTKNLLDYNDLLYFTERLLANDELIRSNIDKKYKYISCDEYQDSATCSTISH